MTDHSTASRAPDAPAELLWLLGQPPLADFIAFVEEKVADGRKLDPRRLVADWRRANDLYYDLEASEAGIADAIEVLPAEPELAERMRRLKRNPWFRSSFDNLPFEIVKVEIDKLVVSQVHVERGAVFDRARALDLTNPAALFDFCLPAEPPPPAVETRELGDGRWLYTCRSTDFRAHAAKPIAPALLPRDFASGPLAAALVVGVGFGSNFVSGIRSGDRVLLQNGYHRTFALRDCGATHVYCVVETVTRKDELRLTADAEVGADPEFYFASKRPPIFRDFFDPRIVRTLPVLPVDTHVEIEVKVRSGTSVVATA